MTAQSRVLFTDIELYTSTWLQTLYPNAAVLCKDIKELSREDLYGKYERVHCFAGIGGWEYALELAGWPASEPVWTGSCPCQPFSHAGRGGGESDPRHLWPEFRRLIKECRPPTIFGEQVASTTGREWLARVFTDLEELGYAVAGADLCAAGVGAPHIRQRLYWVAHSQFPRPTGEGRPLNPTREPLQRRGIGRVAHSDRQRNENDGSREVVAPTAGMQGANGQRQWIWPNPWERSDALYCLDGKYRRFEPSARPLVDGATARVGRLRAYGNAIVPQVAATFIKSYLETRGASL